jgi:predicted GH43/DUF377 family glycosyl hydrolase
MGGGAAMLLCVAAAAATSPPHHKYPTNCSDGLARQSDYDVVVMQRNAVPGGGALISRMSAFGAVGPNNTAFNFSFATAWFPTPDGGDGLIVRNVECSDDHHACTGVAHPQWTNAGALAVVKASLGASAPAVEPVTEASIFWAGTPPPSPLERWGAADPRCAYRKADKTYYLTWDNCTRNCYPHRSTYLSTSTDPFNPDSWTLHGPILPGIYTGGASLLMRESPPHYAFVGNSNTANAILLASSQDGVKWTQENQSFMSNRPGCWDEKGVAAGPQPERLSNGDYLYIYNIDTGFPFHPNTPYSYLGRCAIGWAILDQNDPTKIVARSTDALLISELPFETCGGEKNKGRLCQEPLVMFSTGMKPLGNDEFYVIYGAADTSVGMTKIKVNYHK